MNEDVWLTCRRVDRLLGWLIPPSEPIRTRWQGRKWASARRTSERKLRLFACACRRRMPGGGPVADVVEDWVEGRTSAEGRDALLRPLGFTHLEALVEHAALDLAPAAVVDTLRTAFGIFHGYEADLLREVVGNPFRPAAVPPALLAWNDRTLPRLAEAIATNRAYGDLPILGDALEEAGCDDERLAAHCRAGVAHVAGCWALDAVMGKA